MLKTTKIQIYTEYIGSSCEANVRRAAVINKSNATLIMLAIQISQY